MWRMGVPVATPVRLADAIGAVLSGPRQPAHFEDELRRMFSPSLLALTGSGRTALYAVLAALEGAGDRDEVVIPAFVCPSVARAVLKAGCQPVLCDVTLHDFGLDPRAVAALLTSRTAAVVAAHLFGYPADLAPILRLCRDAGAMLVEDAAQAFSARCSGRPAGTTGDAAVFSFSPSKVIGTGGAGLAMAAHPAIAAGLPRVLDGLAPAGHWRQLAYLLGTTATGLLVRSHHLGPVARVWAGSMRGQHDGDDFAARRCGAWQAGVAHRVYERLETITAARRRNAEWLRERLAGLRGIALRQAAPGTEPVFLRLPVVVDDPRLKSSVLQKLRAAGVNASEMYARASLELLRTLAVSRTPCPNTEYLVDRMVDLPTHPYLGMRELSAMELAFRRTFGRGATHAAAT